MASKTYWYENKWEKDKKVTPKLDKKASAIVDINAAPIAEPIAAPKVNEDTNDIWKDEEKELKWKAKEKNANRDAKGEGQLLVERKIVFNPPDNDVVLGVETVSKEAQVTEVELAQDIAIVRGMLYKNIIYKTVKREDVEKALNLEKEGNDESNENKEANENNEKNESNENNDKKGPACESVMPESIAIDGVVRHTTVRIPFEFIIDLPGAMPGQNYEVVSTMIKNDLGGQYIYDEETTYKVSDTGMSNQIFIAALIEKDIIKVTLRAFEQ